MKNRFVVSIGLCLLLLFSMSATRGPVPDTLDLFLLIGQSNMAGRGIPDSRSMPENQAIWSLDKNDTWSLARDPLHFDKPSLVGVGPGLAFAQRWHSLHPDVRIGLVPCAVGGSSIDQWQAGALHPETGIYPYDAMLRRIKIAQQKGKVRAILWHQGESDSNAEKSKAYEDKLSRFFEKLRKDVGAPDAPILIGTLGDFFLMKNSHAKRINDIIEGYPNKHNNVYSVSSAGLTHKGDTTHFDTPSARELGKRYAETLWKQVKK